MAGRESHRERLREGALIAMRERGYARTTARDVAAAAGVSLGSIGYHYGSTEALLLEALRDGFAEWTAHVERRVRAEAAAGASIGEQALHAVAGMLTTLDEHRGLATAFVEALAPAMHSEELRERLAEMMQQTREAYVVALRTALGDEAGSAHGEVLASLLIAVLDGLMVQALLDPARTPTGAQIAAALTELGPRLVRRRP